MRKHVWSLQRHTFNCCPNKCNLMGRAVLLEDFSFFTIYGRPQCNLVGIKRSYPFRYLLSRHALLIVASSASSGTPNAPYKSLSRSTASWSNIFSDFKANFVLSALRFPSSACPSCWQVSLHRYPTHADLHHPLKGTCSSVYQQRRGSHPSVAAEGPRAP